MPSKSAWTRLCLHHHCIQTRRGHLHLGRRPSHWTSSHQTACNHIATAGNSREEPRRFLIREADCLKTCRTGADILFFKPCFVHALPKGITRLGRPFCFKRSIWIIGPFFEEGPTGQERRTEPAREPTTHLSTFLFYFFFFFFFLLLYSSGVFFITTDCQRERTVQWMGMGNL